jgi:hypothetical protein
MLAACGQVNVPRNTGLYLLIDTSGTYNRQVTQKRAFASRVEKFSCRSLSSSRRRIPVTRRS